MNNKKEYKTAYEKCLTTETNFMKDVENGLANNDNNELVKESFKNKKEEIEKCDGCYNYCGGCDTPKMSYPFTVWLVKKFDFSTYGCIAMCIPTCMPKPH